MSDSDQNDHGAGDPEGAVTPSVKASDPTPRPVRRRALLLGGAGLAGGLAAVGTAGYLRLRRGGTSGAPSATIADHRVALPATTPKLVVARGASPEKNVNAAIARIGGMRTLVSRDDVVLVKPNIGWDRTAAQAANTDPEVVAALVRACLAAGAKEVIVTDVSCNDAGPSFHNSGIADAARRAGARVLLPSEVEKRSVSIPGKAGSWTVLEPYVRATKVINVPVAKHHGMAKLTAGMKNWFGLVDGERKLLHGGLTESIVGLASLMRPTLTVVDLTRVLLRNGPRGGNLADVKRLDTIALSFDPVAVDAWAATQLGFDPADIEHVQLAQSRGLGTTDFKSLAPIEIQT